MCFLTKIPSLYKIDHKKCDLQLYRFGTLVKYYKSWHSCNGRGLAWISQRHSVVIILTTSINKMSAMSIWVIFDNLWLILGFSRSDHNRTCILRYHEVLTNLGRTKLCNGSIFKYAQIWFIRGWEVLQQSYVQFRNFLNFEDLKNLTQDKLFD